MKTPPTKDQRDKCWNARDAYFKCLDENDLWLNGYKPSNHDEIVNLNLNNLKKGTSKDLYVCQKLRDFYSSQCIGSWVLHFENLRLEEKQKEYLINRMQEQEKQRMNGNEFWERVQKPK